MTISYFKNGAKADLFELDRTVNLTPDEGQIVWSEEDCGPVVGMGKSDGIPVIQSIGLETYYRVINISGASIADGACCMSVGAVGNSGKIKVDLAIADGSVLPRYILGLATETIANGKQGFLTMFGLVRGIKTNGQGGETWVDGNILYASPTTPGNLTNIEPSAPNLKIPIAMVINSHPTNGQLFVRATTHGFNLGELHDVHISNPQNGQVLKYVSANSRWENSAP